MHIIIASIVRIFALRPQLNRFVMNGRLYKRNKIYVSFSVKKRLRDDAEETSIKLEFEGTENIFEVKEKWMKASAKPVLPNKTLRRAKQRKSFRFYLISSLSIALGF